MRVYRGNFDGRRNALVAAPNQREAAKLVRTSMYDFRNFYSRTTKPEDVSVAVAKPGTVFVRKMQSKEPWQEL